MNVKETIIKFHPNCKNIVISSPVVRTDKKEANNILKKYNNILKQEERNVIFHNNISASHLHRDGLHLNLNGTIILVVNLLSRICTFWQNEDSNKSLPRLICESRLYDTTCFLLGSFFLVSAC